MIFSQHIYELKFRIFYFLLSFFLCWYLTYFYKYEFLYLVNFTKKESYFIFTNASEVFLSLLKASFLIGFLYSLPYLIFQTGCFFIPCLYFYEAQRIFRILKKILFFSLFGNYFFITCIFPWSWNFFLGFESTLQNSIVSIYFENKIQDYLNFFIQFFFFFNLLIFFGLILYYFFENFLGFSKSRKLIYLSIIILAGCITPPDVLTQLWIGLPIIAGYEFTIFCQLLKKFIFLRR